MNDALSIRYKGAHERLTNPEMRVIDDDFWDVVRTMKREQERSTIDGFGLVKPFSIYASRWLRNKGKK